MSKYFPNNWQKYKDSPDDMFIPHTFGEFMDWRVGQWELPESVCCVVRSMNIRTKKVKETYYTKESDARKYIKSLINDNDIEFSVADHNAVHYVYPQEPSNA